ALLAEAGERLVERDLRRLGPFGLRRGGDLELRQHEVSVGRAAGPLGRDPRVLERLQADLLDALQARVGDDHVVALPVLPRRDDRQVGLRRQRRAVGGLKLRGQQREPLAAVLVLLLPVGLLRGLLRLVLLEGRLFFSDVVLSLLLLRGEAGRDLLLVGAQLLLRLRDRVLAVLLEL